MFLSRAGLDKILSTFWSVIKSLFIGYSLENVTRSGSTFVPGSGAWWTNGLDRSDGSSFTV